MEGRHLIAAGFCIALFAGSLAHHQPEKTVIINATGAEAGQIVCLEDGKRVNRISCHMAKPALEVSRINGDTEFHIFDKRWANMRCLKGHNYRVSRLVIVMCEKANLTVSIHAMPEGYEHNIALRNDLVRSMPPGIVISARDMAWFFDWAKVGTIIIFDIGETAKRENGHSTVAGAGGHTPSAHPDQLTLYNKLQVLKPDSKYYLSV